MALTSSTVVGDVLDVKRQQLILLFSTWDEEASGRVHVRHVPAILRAVFSAETQPELSTSRIRAAYQQVTGRTWQASQRDTRLKGPTVNDLMEMLKYLGCVHATSTEDGAEVLDGAASLARAAVNDELAQIVSIVEAHAENSANTDGLSVPVAGFSNLEWRTVVPYVTEAVRCDGDGAKLYRGDLVERVFPITAQVSM